MRRRARVPDVTTESAAYGARRNRAHPAIHPQFIDASRKSFTIPRPVADNGGMSPHDDDHRARRSTCDETRPTRLHYQLRCLLPEGHEGEHRWTPELLTSDAGEEAATG
jgi:hypothetical protein